MPQAIAAAVSAFAFNAGVSALVATAIYSTVYVAAYVAGSLLLDKAINALTPKPKGTALGGGSITAPYSGTTEPVRLIFGRQRVAGLNTIPALTTGTTGEFLHQIMTLAGREIDGYEDVYFNDELITNASIGAISGTTADGVLSTGKYANKAWVRRYSGTATQTRDFILGNAYPSAFTTDFRGRGIAYVALTYSWDSDVYGGPPPAATFVVRGHRVYDPRLDSTKPGGSGAHRDNDPTTWAWSQNPALILRHYLTLDIGGGYAHADIDDGLVMAAANICDQTVTVPSGTQPRYTCNLTLSAASGNDDLFEANVRSIIDCMRGRMLEVEGKLLMFAGIWDIPLARTITESDWITPLEIQLSAPRDERWNAVRVFYVDAARAYQRVAAYERRNAAYVSADAGDLFTLDVEAPGCSNEYEAQRLGELYLRMSRNQIKLAGALGPRWAELRPQDIIYVTHTRYGWASKTFRVLACEVTHEGGIAVSMVEEGAALWTDLLSSEYNAPSNPLALDPGVTQPATPQSFVGIVNPGNIDFNWSPGSYSIYGQNYELFRNDVGSVTAAGTTIWAGAAQRVVLNADPRSPYYYFVRGRVTSATGPYTAPSPLLAPLIPSEALPGNRVFADGELYYGISSYWNFRNVITSAASLTIVVGSGFTADRSSIVLTVPNETNWINDATIANELRVQPLRVEQARSAPIGAPVMPLQSGIAYGAITRSNSFTTGGVQVNLLAALTTTSKFILPSYTLVASAFWSVDSALPGTWATFATSYTLGNSKFDYLALRISIHRSVLNVTGSGQLFIGQLQMSVI